MVQTCSRTRSAAAQWDIGFMYEFGRGVPASSLFEISERLERIRNSALILAGQSGVKAAGEETTETHPAASDRSFGGCFSVDLIMWSQCGFQL